MSMPVIYLWPACSYVFTTTLCFCVYLRRELDLLTLGSIKHADVDRWVGMNKRLVFQDLARLKEKVPGGQLGSLRH